MCVSGEISGLDHLQLAMPRGGEERAYFDGLLGLEELEKPAELARSGGVWFGRAAATSRGRRAVSA